MLHPAPYVSAKHNVVLQTATAANIRSFIVAGSIWKSRRRDACRPRRSRAPAPSHGVHPSQNLPRSPTDIWGGGTATPPQIPDPWPAYVVCGGIHWRAGARVLPRPPPPALPWQRSF